MRWQPSVASPREVLIVLLTAPVAAPRPTVLLEGGHGGATAQDDAGLAAVLGGLPFGHPVERPAGFRVDLVTLDPRVLHRVDVDREPECMRRQPCRAFNRATVECARIVCRHGCAVTTAVLVYAIHALDAQCRAVMDLGKDASEHAGSRFGDNELASCRSAGKVAEGNGQQNETI